jgi:hypothetical protein
MATVRYNGKKKTCNSFWKYHDHKYRKNPYDPRYDGPRPNEVLSVKTISFLKLSAGKLLLLRNLNIAAVLISTEFRNAIYDLATDDKERKHITEVVCCFNSKCSWKKPMEYGTFSKPVAAGKKGKYDDSKIDWYDLTGLFMVNKQIHQEVSYYVWSKITFYIEKMDHFELLANRISNDHGMWVKKLVFAKEIWHLPSRWDDNPQGFDRLFNVIISTFPNIEHLTLTISLSGHSKPLSFSTNEWVSPLDKIHLLTSLKLLEINYLPRHVTPYEWRFFGFPVEDRLIRGICVLCACLNYRIRAELLSEDRGWEHIQETI